TWETEEGTIAYRSVGTGRPLLLIHSMMLGASSREWDDVIDGLSEKYHVYAIDLPGFGNSYCPEEPWTAYQYAQFLHTFIKEVINRPVCICGANGGADFALTLSMLHPEQVKRMVLISPEGIGKGFATEEDTKSLPLLLKPVAGTQKFLMGTSKKAIKGQLETAFHAKETISAELVQRYADAARFGDHAQATYAGIATRFYAADTKPAFEKLSVPFLMIWGEENKANPVTHFDTAEKMKDFGAFAVFENTGALPHMENSKAFLENTKEFLK
ncbi:MAG: alpha/beta hydrolase, partial [Anaerotignum sp.]|nr:alpha/beta hydrolase [Anaerotignum sp.]